MKYLFYAIVFDVAGNTAAVGSSASPAKTITTNIQKVTGISINPSSAQTKNIGENFTITATVSPSDANNKGVNWSSSNSGVATVDSSGNVHCLAAGKTTITVTSADGSGKSASLELTVRDPLTSLTLDKPQTTLLYGGATTTVTAQTTPADYDANNLTWTIGDTSLATISGSGKTRTITSNNTKKTGETTLTVSGGGKTATMKVSIVNFTTTTYSYTGTVQQVDLPAGTYKLEVWGAQGGDDGGQGTSGTPGKGGYSVGTVTLKSTTITYVYVGGNGLDGLEGSVAKKGGFNGGGKNGNDQSGSQGQGGSGGGGSDIRLANDSLYARVIVAGGGGGAANDEGSRSSVNGGYGGGISGQTVYLTNYAYGGTQTSGGNTTGKDTGFPNSESATPGQFGIGGNGGGGVCGAGGGGGGGWYGGGGGVGAFESGGGGGSGYVYTSTTASNYPSGCLLNSSYYLTNAETKAGNTSFPNVAGTGNETGHSGNGAAKITPVN